MINYKLNQDNRIKIIDCYENNRLKQININRYLVPYRMSSHNKKVYIYEQNKELFAVFYIHDGITRDNICIYSSVKNNTDDELKKILKKYYNLDVSQIKKMDSQWYLAIVDDKYLFT